MLRPVWQTTLGLHSPTNVVIGRIGREAVLCVQGTASANGQKAAGVEMLSDRGYPRWRDTWQVGGQSTLPGAYLQWIDVAAGEEPLVLYSFVAESRDIPGGARMLQSRDGTHVGNIQNVTRFGNNNSIVADLDSDGRNELVYADQRTLTCYSLPTLRQRWRYDDGVLFCWSLPALADIDGDATPEIIFGSEYNNAAGDSSMIAINAAGKTLWRSDGHVEDLGSTPVFVVDVDGDGVREIVKVGLDLEHRRNLAWNHVHVFDAAGRLVRKIKFGCTGLAIGDMDGDGKLEGVGLTNTRDGGNNGRREIRCIDLATGQLRWATPVERAYLDTNSPLMADLDRDGRLEAIVGTGNPAGYARLPNSEPWGDLYVVEASGEIRQHETLSGWPVNLAICDIDDDGFSELTVVIDGLPGQLAVYRTASVAARRDWPTPFGDAARRGTAALPTE